MLPQLEIWRRSSSYVPEVGGPRGDGSPQLDGRQGRCFLLHAIWCCMIR